MAFEEVGQAEDSFHGLKGLACQRRPSSVGKGIEKAGRWGAAKVAGMSPDMVMKLSTMAAIAACLLGPPLLVFVVVRTIKGALWLALGLATLALAVSFYLVFFRMFPDFFGAPSGPKATIEVVLPDQYRGFVYLFFDSRQAPLQPSSPNVYTVFVPASGRLRAGQIAGRPVSGDSANFAIRHLNGQPALIAEGSQTGGSQSKGGWSVVYIRPFVGSTAEFDSVRKERMAKNTFFDELSVFEEMLKAASAPAAPITPAALDGIHSAPP
jgi:hypothetical protein